RIENWEARLKEQEQELNALSAEIGSSRFKPLGIVKNINVHW
ncbi:MAG: hypothetical protein H6Q39_847, partial [Chloroflexi bacterium]|nr:hypothetical protein [Chloroflexota bacterium]